MKSQKVISITKIYRYSIYTLLFLFGVDFLGFSGYIFLLMSLLILFKMIASREFRISLSLILLLSFSAVFYITYEVCYGFNPKHVIQLLLGPSFAFLIGTNLPRTFSEKKKTILNAIIILFLGFSSHAFLNLLYRMVEFGLFGSNARVAPDIWSGVFLSATLMGLLVTPLSSLFFPIVLIKFKEKKWYHILAVSFGTIVALYNTVILSNRTFIIIFAFSFLATFALLFIKEKETRRKTLKILFVSSLCFLVFLLIFSLNLFKIRDAFLSIPIINRIITEGFSTSRFDFVKAFFSQWWRYLFGGNHFSLPGGEPIIYMHNVWLDIYSIGGIIPFCLFLFITYIFIKKLINILKNEKNMMICAILVSISVCFFSLFLVEPVIQGQIYLFLSFFLFFGIVTEQSDEKKVVVLPKYEGRSFSERDVRVVFISNYLSIHQIDLCLEFNKQYPDRFHFIATEPFPEERKKLGAFSKIEVKNEIRAYENEAAKKIAFDLLDKADVIIYGSCRDSWVKKQIFHGKIVFKYTERLYKKSAYQYLRLRSIISQYLHFKRFEKSNVFILCASAYTAFDFSLFDSYLGRCFKWGYFTIPNYIKDYSLLEGMKKNECVKITFVNRLIPLKHPEKIINIAKSLLDIGITNFHVDFVGSGEEPYVRELIESVQTKNLCEYITFLGPIKNEYVRNLLNKSNIVISSSDRQEGWGAIVSEAMASGCCVIASNTTGSSRFLISNGLNGFIYNFDDDESLLLIVKKLIEDTGLRDKIGKEAFQTVQNTWNATTATYRFNDFILNYTSKGKLKEYESGPFSKAEIIDDKDNLGLSETNKNQPFISTKTKKGMGFKKTALISYLAILFDIIAVLLYTPWMLRELGPDNYAIFSLSNSIVAVLAIDLGLGLAVSTYISRYRAAGDEKTANNFSGMIFRLFFIISIIVFLLLVLVFFFLGNIFVTFSFEQIATLKGVFLIVSFYSLVILTLSPLNGILIGNEYFYKIKTLGFAQKFLTISLVVLSLVLKQGLYVFVLCNCFSVMVINGVKFYIVKKHKLFGSSPDFSYKNPALKNEVLLFSLWVFVVSIASRLLINIIPTFLGIFSGPSQIVVFSLGSTIEGYVYTISTALAGMFLPYLSQLDHRGATNEKIEDFSIKVGRIQLMIMGLILTGFISLGNGFLSVWMPNTPEIQYSDSYYVVLLLTIPYFVIYTQQVEENLLAVKNKYKYRAIPYLIAGAINVILAPLFIGLFSSKGAIVGAACICFADVVGLVVIQNVFYKKELKVNLKLFFIKCHFSLIAPILLSTVIGLIIEYFWPTGSWTTFFIKGFLFVCFYFFSMWFLGMNDFEKKQISSLIWKIAEPFSRINERSISNENYQYISRTDNSLTKKVIFINTGVHGSTGRIMLDMAQMAESNGFVAKIINGRDIGINSYFLVNRSLFFLNINAFLSRVFGKHDFYNVMETKRLVNYLKKEQPDLLHIHNLHGNYINIKILFNYLNEGKIPVIWTFHDCWPFTGHCTHFERVGCSKWKTGCHHCPLFGSYPKSWFFDRSKKMWLEKRSLFTQRNDIIVVSPSKWLNSLIDYSFLKGNKRQVIRNGIDLTIFKPNFSIYKEKLGLKDKKVILGVSSPWTIGKGLVFFNELADLIDEKSKIVLVGIATGDVVSEKIISLPKFSDPNELAKIYSIADVFVNPTLEDNFPTVNLEALACGIPVVSFDTGGCSEQIDKTCGKIVYTKDSLHLFLAIKEVMSSKIHTQDCISRAKIFDKKETLLLYLDLYKDMTGKSKK